jgi:GMP synthase-like glutamine amidotransferase
MRILVVQNFEDTGLGQIAAALDEKSASVTVVNAHLGEPLPGGTNGYDGLVVLGGGQNALDDEGSPWFPDLLGLMRGFVDSGRATLGVCLGSQLLARAYGADNLIGAAREFSWREVELTEDGRSDAVLGGLPERFPIFQWHDDTFTLPRGGVRLAGISQRTTRPSASAVPAMACSSTSRRTAHWFGSGMRRLRSGSPNASPAGRSGMTRKPRATALRPTRLVLPSPEPG